MSKRSSAEKGSDSEIIKEELVRFDNVKSSYYTEAARVTLTYTLTASNISFTPHDWIGLFPAKWRETSDSLAFTLAASKSKSKKKKKRGSDEDRRQVEFPLNDASENIITDSKKHRYQFVYVSKNGKVYGRSHTFSIQGDELWNLADDDEESSRLSTLQSSPTTVGHDSEISILSRSQATSIECPSESPVLLSYPSDLESDGGDATNHEDWDITNAINENSKTGERDNRRVSETALSEFSDIEILSTSPSKDDYSGQYNTSSGKNAEGVVFPEDDFTLCDIKISNNHFGVVFSEKVGGDKEKDGSERSISRKSKKKRKERMNSECSETGVLEKENDTKIFEDKDGSSQKSSLDSCRKSEKEKKKKTEYQRKAVDTCIPQSNAINSCEKLCGSLSEKSKTTKLKASIEDAIDSKGSGVRNEIESKKFTKEKWCHEKAHVNIESIPSPPLFYSTASNMSKTVAEQLKFLDTDEDVKSIHLSDVEGDEKKECVCAMSRKQKRKMRKMMQEKASTNNKTLIVELKAEEEDEKNAALAKVNVQTADCVTSDSTIPSDIISAQETIRGKKIKKKSSGRCEVYSESTSNSSHESNTSAAISSHDKSTLQLTSSVSDNKNTISDNDGKLNKSSRTDSGKNNSRDRKVYKDKNNGLLIFFESQVDAKSENAKLDIDSLERNSTPQPEYNTNTYRKKENRVRDKDSKCDKKLKRSSKEGNLGYEIPKPGLDVVVDTRMSTDFEKNVFQVNRTESAKMGQETVRNKKSKSSTAKNATNEDKQSAIPIIEKLPTEEVRKRKIECESNVEPLTGDDETDSKHTQSSKDSKRKSGVLIDVPIKASKNNAITDNQIEVQQPVKKSRDERRKIPKNATITVQAHQSEIENNLDKLDRCPNRCVTSKCTDQEKCRNEIFNFPIDIGYEEREFTTKSNDDKVNNNFVNDTVGQDKSVQQSRVNGKKSNRKSKSNIPSGKQSEVKISPQDMSAQTSSQAESQSKDVSGVVNDKCSEGSHVELNASIFQSAFSGSGTIELKRPETEDCSKRLNISSPDSPTEDAKTNMTKKRRKALAKIDIQENEAADLSSTSMNESKLVSFTSNEENAKKETTKADNCSIKGRQVSSPDFVDEEWDISGKENTKASIRNKLYLAKKEKMKAAIKAKRNKKERRSKGKNENIIMLKELFEESYASPTASMEKLAQPKPCKRHDTVAPNIRPAISSTLRSSSIPTTSTTALGMKRHQIPAYLLDVIDDLPEDPDIPNFREWRKSMAYGKTKRQSQDCDMVFGDPICEQQKTKIRRESLTLDTQDCSDVLKQRERGKTLKSNVLPPPPLTEIKTACRVDDNENNIVVDDDDKEFILKRTLNFVPLLSYANVLKGLSTSLNKVKINENLGVHQCPSHFGKTTMKSSSKCHPRGKQQQKQEKQLDDDRKMLIRARRSIFSPSYKNLFNAALETQCYLLDKVEGRLMGKHPQFSRRSKLRAATKIKMKKQKQKKLIQARLQCRTQKEMLNGEMLSTAVVPMCTSLACEPSGSYSLTSNESNESVSSVVWPFPVKLSIVPHENVIEDLESGTSDLKEMIPLNNDESYLRLTDNDTACSSSTDNQDNAILRQFESMWLAESRNIPDAARSPLSTDARCRAKSRCLRSKKLSGYPKTLELAHFVQQRLRSDLTEKEREIASLENKVNCLKEVVKRQSKQEIKARFKLIAIKRKYHLLKAAKGSRRGSADEPEWVNPSNDDCDIGETEDDLVLEPPPCKRRKLQDSASASQEAQDKSNTDRAETSDSGKTKLRKDGHNEMTLDKSPRLYPDIQKELSDLQKEFGRYSDHWRENEQHRQWQSYPQGVTAQNDETSFVFQEPMVSTSTGGRNDYPNQSEDPFNFPGKYPTEVSSMSSRSFQVLNPKPLENIPPQNQATSTEFSLRHQPKFGTRAANHYAPQLQPQFSQTFFPATTSHNSLSNQFSPSKLPLLPTPPQAIPPLFNPNSSRPINTMTLNHMTMSNATTSLNTDRAARGYSCPPHQRSKSPMVAYHQTSPVRKTQASHSTHKPTTFGKHRYNPLARNSQPATMTVAPRPRHFNRPFPCNDCRHCLCPNSPRVSMEPYYEYPLDFCPYSEEARSPERIVCFVPETNTGAYHVTCPYYDNQTEASGPSNYINPYIPSGPSCEPRENCNCCHNNYNRSYQH